MKIAVLSRYPEDSSRPRGGVESVTVVLARALALLDDLQVHIITVERTRTAPSVQNSDGLTIHRLPGSRWPQILDVVAGPGRKRLLQCLDEIKPDVLHTHETYALGLTETRCPHVFTVHGFDHANIKADSARLAAIRSRLWKSLERRGLAAHKHIISITPYVRQMIEPLTSAEIYDIENPVDERFFNIEPNPEPGRILCVGWVNERKNTVGAVRAFASVASAHRHARLIIAGAARSSEYLDRVKRTIDQHGLADRVEMLGYIDRSRLEQELASADIFLLPSRQENSPMAIAEAMACGVPSIAANRCGMPWMIDHGRTGYLVDPESTEDIATWLTKLLTDPQLARRMGAAAGDAARQRFHPRAVASRTRDVYRRLCGC